MKGQGFLGKKGKSMGRLFALQIKEDIPTASAKLKERQLTPSSKGSRKLGTPTSKFEIILHLSLLSLLTNVIIQLVCVCVCSLIVNCFHEVKRHRGGA